MGCRDTQTTEGKDDMTDSPPAYTYNHPKTGKYEEQTAAPGTAPTGTTEAVFAIQKSLIKTKRDMEFVGVNIDVLYEGLFNIVRVGRKWADLQVGEVVRLTCTEIAGGFVVDSLEATVVRVDTGPMHELIRGHSATNFSVRGESNPETRENKLAMEIRGHYNLGTGPDMVTKSGTVVYFMPIPKCDIDRS